MPKILSFHPSPELEKENPFKYAWEEYKSLDWFSKVFVISFLLIAISTPFIVNNIQIFNSKAQIPIIEPSLPAISADIIFPSDAGVINVKDSLYGAKGDGVTDDTAAIQKAVSDNLNKIEKGLAVIIYFPAGTYIVTNNILPQVNVAITGGWSPYVTLQGQNRDKSIIKLKDNAPGYNSKSVPKTVLFTASLGVANGNKGFNNNIFDLTVDTGNGNPGAIGIDYLASNNGEVRNVTIKSGDGTGNVGLSLTRPWPGPALINNVLIEGFDYGIQASQTQYGMTFEHITLNNQKVAGIQNDGNVFSIRDLKSANSVPVIKNTLDKGLVTLIDGSFAGGSPSASAIENDAGELFARNINAVGYQSAIKNKGAIVSGQSISEFTSTGPYSLFPSPQTSLNLPVKDPPEVPWDPLDQWVSVQAYGADGSGRKDFDNSPAVQTAIDAADGLGKTTLYFPKGKYAFGDTIHVRGNIRRVHFMMSSLGVVNSAANKFADERPIISIENGKQPVVMMESIGPGFDTNSKLKPRFILKHVSSSTLVMRNMAGNYQNVPGSGQVFFEDMQGCSEFHSTKVWARQLNPELCAKPPAPAFDPKILNDESDVWILGLKTEKPATIVETKNGGRTEVLGGLIFPVWAVPIDMPAFINTDSSHSLSFVVNAYEVGTGHEVVIKETRSGVTKQLTKSQVLPRGQGSMVPLYAGYIEGVPTPIPTPTPTQSSTPTLTPSLILTPTLTPTPTLVPGDTTPPTTSITSPLNGSTISTKSTTTITANATDNVGVGRVEFYVNGGLKCNDTTSPYSCTSFGPATHKKTYQLQTKAYDTSNNSSLSPIVTVTGQ